MIQRKKNSSLTSLTTRVKIRASSLVHRPSLKIILAFFLAVIIAGAALLFFNRSETEAAWWDDAWRYRQKVPISYTGTENLTEYQVLVDNLDTATMVTNGKLQSDCDDLRFVSQDGQVLSYFIVANTCNTATTKVWVKTARIDAGDSDIYIYYGNGNASAASNIDTTFSYSSEKTVGYVLYSSVDDLDIISLSPGNSITHNGKTISLDKFETDTTSIGVGATAVSQYGTITAKGAFNADDDSDDTDSIVPVSWAGTEFYIHNRNTSITINALAPWGDATVTVYSNGTAATGCNGVTVSTTGTTLSCTGTAAGVTRVSSDVPIVGFLVSGTADHTPLKPVTTQTWIGGGSTTAVDNGASSLDFRFISNSDASETDPADLAANTEDSTSVTGDSGFGGGAILVRSANSVYNYGVAQNSDGDGSDQHVYSDVTEAGYVAASAHQADYISVASTSPATCSVYNLGSSTPIATQTATSSNTSIYFTGFGTGSGTAYTSGAWQLTCDAPVIAHYQDATNSEEALMTHVLMRQFTYPTPSVGALASEEVGTAPVSHWAFDEGTGSTAYDTMGINDGTLGTGTSAPTWISDDQCQSEKCLEFDGALDYVQVADSSSLDLSSFTMSMWVYWHSGAGTSIDKLLDKVTSVPAGWSLRLSNGAKIGFWNNGTWVEGSTLNWNNNTWYHISVTHDGTTIRFYRDGVSAGASSMTLGSVNTAEPMKIGGAGLSESPQPFHGKLDDIKIYPYARTASQVKADFTARGSPEGVSAQFGGDNIGETLSNGLISYWKMDETAANTCTGGSNDSCDSSGNANDAAWNGNTTSASTAGKFGNAITLDGTGDNASIGTDVYSASELTSGTLSAWFYADTASRDQFVVSLEGIIWFGRFASTDTNLIMSFYDGSSYELSTGADFDTGEWHLMTGTWDGTKVRLYMDGKFVTETTAGSPAMDAFSRGNTIGSIYTGTGNSFDGRIDEVRLYNRVFSPREVEALYNFAPGPVGWWKIDDGTGTSAVDSSGSGYTGTLGSGSSAPSWTSGQYGNSLQFDGKNDYVSVGSVAVTEDWTISTWARIANSTPTIQYPIGASTTSDNGLFVEFSSSSDAWGFYDGTTTLTGSNLNENEWVHLTVTKSSTTYTLYKNGIEENSGTRNDVDLTDVQFGRRSGNPTSWYYAGNVDDVRIYNYARTQKQIIQDMNAGHPAVGSPVGSPIAHWALDEGYGSTIYNSGNIGVGVTANGTLGSGSSAPSWTNDGKFGKALSFDGNNDSVSMGDVSILELDFPFTLSAWINLDTLPSTDENYNIISKYYALTNDREWYFSVVTATDTLQFGKSETGTSATLTSFNSNTAFTSSDIGAWVHVMVSIDASGNYTFYRNGRADGTGTFASTTIHHDVANAMIGAVNHSSSNPDHFFDGKIDEVKIYDFALSTDEVKAEYNQGKAAVLGSTGTSSSSPNVADNSSTRQYCPPGDTGTCNAPVAEWFMDEGTGTSANDTTGNSNTGTLGSGNSAPVWSSGIQGNSLKFDGINDIVSATDSDSFTGSTLSWEFWMKANTGMSGAKHMINKYVAASSQRSWTVLYNGGSSIGITLSSDGTNNAQSASTTLPTEGVWHHIAITYNAGTVTFYFDGIRESQATNSQTTTFNNSNVVKIGASGDTTPSGFFDGFLDQVRIYNYVRTPEQVAWSYSKGAPIAYYAFDECEGATAYNSAPTYNDSAAGNNGTITIGSSGGNTDHGTCTSGTTSDAWNNGASGKRNASLDFDNTDDYVSIADADKFSFGDGSTDRPFSLSGWFNADTINTAAFSSAADFMVTKDDNNAVREWGVALGETDDLRFQVRDDSATAALSIEYSGISTGTWYHFVATYDGSASVSGLKVYIDGKLAPVADTSTGSYTAMENGAASVILGSWATAVSNLFDGQLDEVKIFNYELTPQQVRTEYAEGAVRFE
ncbi:DUF2341 domain-containing protein [Candidatus Roizmanbacteria bacterium]|nr:DUF2341 domain-containing protein [Candidatus Roizmanbacteria bacterium]